MVFIMSCYHPLKAWQIGYHASGKPEYKITSYNALYLVKRFRDRYDVAFEELPDDKFCPKITEFIEIPCGHCIGCRLDYSRQWASRCLLELNYHDKASFLTLTYDDEHLPECLEFIDSDGVINKSIYHPLVKRDLQLFIKRLRKYYSNDKLRYYACGEYGSKSMRPHFHVILFGVDFSENRQLFKQNFNGDNYYISPIVSQLWKYGLHIIGDVTFDSVAYTARYTAKKLGNEFKGVYDDIGIPPEFSIMSRRPGIGRLYYDDHKDEIYKFDQIVLNEGRRVKPPKYYDRLYDIDYPSDYLKLKDKRRLIAEENTKSKLNLTSLNYLNMLESSERHKIAQTKAVMFRKEI